MHIIVSFLKENEVLKRYWIMNFLTSGCVVTRVNHLLKIFQHTPNDMEALKAGMVNAMKNGEK